MKAAVKKGSTSQIFLLFIQDSSKGDGSGLTGLAYNSSGLTAYYKRNTASASSSITLANISTLGTYVSGGFKEVDSTYMPGVYEFHPPNACFSSGADNVVVMLRGATNMAPVLIEVQLVDNVEKDVYERIGAPVGASISADIASVQTATDNIASEIGTAGDGLTNIPWNAAWDAEVQSEVADALDAAIPSSPTVKSINDLVLRAATATTAKMTINETTGAYSMKKVDDEGTQETFGGSKAASGTITSGAGITTRDPT